MADAERKQYAKLYRQTPKGRYYHYKRNSKQRRRAFRLSFKEFMKYWQKECWYCGYVLKTIGLDRINSDKGYVKGNLRSACRYCNMGKSDLTTERFLGICANIARRHNLYTGQGGISGSGPIT